MNIIIQPHTAERAAQRGAALQEIEDTLQNGVSIVARNNRLAKAKVFNFDSTRNGKYYQQKKLEVYYVIEYDNMITVTVYVFFGIFQ